MRQRSPALRRSFRSGNPRLTRLTEPDPHVLMYQKLRLVLVELHNIRPVELTAVNSLVTSSSYLYACVRNELGFVLSAMDRHFNVSHVERLGDIHAVRLDQYLRQNAAVPRN